jgi:glycosyltransferase involved in cell wall biosynthesis
MKLVLLGPAHPYRGGIAHHTTRLYSALCLRHTVEFVTFQRQYPRWLFPGRTDKDPGLSSHPVNTIALLDPLNPLSWYQTASHIVAQHPAALIVPWWSVYWALPVATAAHRVRQAGVRVIFVCHNVVSHEPRRGERILTRLVLSQGDGYVTQSREDEKRIAHLGLFAPSQYVPHPIYGRPETPLEPELQLDNKSESRLLFFGLVRAYKGLGVLLKALPTVLAHRCVRLIVAGEFWESRVHYEQLIAELGIAASVELYDRYVPDDEAQALFSRTDLAILPYISTTASGVLSTAIGYGVPVVVSEVGDLGAIVRDNGIGEVVPAGDHEALANAILSALAPARLMDYRRNAARLCENADASWMRLVDAIERLAA